MLAVLLLTTFLGCGATNATPLRVEGTVAAVVTQFASDGSLDLDHIPQFASYLLSMGVNYTFVGGTTGESLSLTTQERMQLLESWEKASGGSALKMIAHVGAESIVDAKALARHAKQHGAVAMGCMPSVFFKPGNLTILAKWLQKVGAEAPELPLYYYHIPSMTGVTFTMLELIKEVESVGIPNFAGVKYTGLYETRAFPDFQRCMAYKDGAYEVFCGREEMMVEALSVGAKGFIGSQFNFAGDLYGEIARQWPHGPYSELQAHALKLLYIELGLPTGVNGVKLIMEYAGLPMGPARLPNVDADQSTRHDFFHALDGWCQEAKTKLNLSLKMCSKDRPAIV
jgi:N-acetylneuraminate lyase